VLFWRREARLTLLDAWAGSPPAAAELLRRLAERGAMEALLPFLKEWEYWCSDLLESHISYPAVAFFLSQHQRQSWVSALTTILDLTALVNAGIEGVPTWQAHVTFAIARHTAVDLSQVLRADPEDVEDRLPASELYGLRDQLEKVGLKPVRHSDADARLLQMRRMYEPYVSGLARRLMTPLPSWWDPQPVRDNWQVSPRVGVGTHL
jgi:hypothetical protein